MKTNHIISGTISTITGIHSKIVIPTCCPASKQELLSSWKKRGAMAVTSGLLGLNNT
jgi:hypothetical protein